MQPCNRIYYSTVHWRLNMFRVAYRSSSGALTVFAASGLHTHVVTGRSQVWVGNQRLQIVKSSWWWAVCHSKHVKPSINFGIINSITKMHLVGYFYWVILRCTDPWISNLSYMQFYGISFMRPYKQFGRWQDVLGTVKLHVQVFLRMNT